MSYVDSWGVRIRYEVQGDGQPIVLARGFTLSFDGHWRPEGWVEYLLAQGRRVIGLDFRGHGASGKPHDPAAYAGNQMPDNVLAVMDALGLERIDLMGYSVGGWISLNLLARFSGRFSSVVAGGSGLRPFRQSEAFIDALEADDPAGITDPGARGFRTFTDSSPDNDRLALAAVQRAERAGADEALLEQVTVPTLLFVGSDDPTREAVQLVARTIPGASLVILPDEDHFSALRAQTCKEAVSEFLKRQVLASR
jgi:pimeloyl-ACP methyl ester carboxylesterase